MEIVLKRLPVQKKSTISLKSRLFISMIDDESELMIIEEEMVIEI